MKFGDLLVRATGRLLCHLGIHPLWTNLYGPSDIVFTCVRCRRRKVVDDW